MATVPAFRMFRSCTALLSSRTLARPAINHPRRFSGRRFYSGEEKADESKAESSQVKGEGQEAGSSKSGKDAGEDGKQANPVADKLAAKEAEVVDLTVCSLLYPHDRFFKVIYLKGRLRYLQADFINLQRNAAREKEQTRDFAITRFAGDLLETADVLAMALKSVPQSALSPPDSLHTPSSEPVSDAPPTSSPPPKSPQVYLQELYTGVEMTHRLLLQTLFKYHVKPFDPTGDMFDPNRHEALYQAPIPGKEPGQVIDCQKIGYTIKDRVLRAAQVGVAQETS